MFKVPIDEKRLDISKLHEELLKLLVVVVFDAQDFLAHAGQFLDLVLNFLLKLGHFAREV